MGNLKIYKYGEPILKKKCEPVEKMTPELKKLIKDMFTTMYNAPGAGLAAPQVGVSIRLCVIDVAPEGKKYPLVLINPRILSKNSKIDAEEGCLSFPGLFEKVKRYDLLKVSAIDENGMPQIIESKGILSRAIQHEMDHLDGKLFIEYLSFFKRKKIESEIKKRKKSGTW